VKEIAVKFIKQYSQLLGTEGGVVGLSGGVDSSVCAALVCDALGPDNCLGVIIPAWDSDPKDESDAKKIGKQLGIKTIKHWMGLDDYFFPEYDFETEVRPLLEKMDTLLPSRIELPYIMKLRGRMHILSYYAKLNNYFQCQTLQKTEWLLGWFDKFGDAAGDIAPIRHLYKTEVFDFAEKYVKEGILPKLILSREPGSGNYPMTDSEELGNLTFDEVDDILIMRNMTIQMIEEKTNISRDKIAKVLNLVKLSNSKRKIPFMLTK